MNRTNAIIDTHSPPFGAKRGRTLSFRQWNSLGSQWKNFTFENFFFPRRIEQDVPKIYLAL
jgi:hypothetical protein